MAKPQKREAAGREALLFHWSKSFPWLSDETLEALRLLSDEALARLEEDFVRALAGAWREAASETRLEALRRAKSRSSAVKLENEAARELERAREGTREKKTSAHRSGKSDWVDPELKGNVPDDLYD